MKYLYLILFCASFTFAQAQTLQSVESVEYDASNNRFLVSNNSNIIARNSDGSLSYFGDGAATAGMEVMGNTLFAIQGGMVKGYDLATAEEVMTITLPGAVFLNGMTNDGVENLYVTDFSTNKIYKINVANFSTPSGAVLIDDTESTPNGIIYDGDNNRLIFVTWGNNAAIKAVDLSDNSITTLTTTPYGSIDGIDEDNDGNYYISYWSSGTHISKYDVDFANPPETITVVGLSNPTDICYAKEIDTLAIPHSSNQVAFIAFNDVTSVKKIPLAEDLDFNIFPNPMENNSTVQFYLEASSEVKLCIYGESGQLLAVLMDGRQVSGIHQIMLKNVSLPKGLLWVNLEVDGNVKALRVMRK